MANLRTKQIKLTTNRLAGASIFTRRVYVKYISNWKFLNKYMRPRLFCLFHYEVRCKK